MSRPRAFRYGLAGGRKSAFLVLGFRRRRARARAGAAGMPRPYLPSDIVRLIDAIARRQKRAAWLLSMNGGC